MSVLLTEFVSSSEDSIRRTTSFTGIFGRLGEGKTLLLAYLCKLHLEDGWDVYTNFGFKHQTGEVQHLMQLRDISNCYIALDDIVVVLDSRQYTNNIAITWMLQLARKKHLKIGYTSQVLSGIDLRLRHITNLITMTNEVHYPHFRLRLYNSEGKIKRKFRIKYLPVIGELYDTDNIVYQKIPLSELLQIFQRSQKKELFKPYVSAKYNINPNLAGTIYDTLRIEKIEFLQELLHFHGFILDWAGRAGEAG